MPEQPKLKEILKEVRRIEILTSNIVNDVFAGEYESAFKGKGMEFDEIREYQPGDDIRMIDWNVTARVGHPYVKKFVEERELTVMLLVDASASMDFGTVTFTKKEIVTRICALLAFTALKSNDKIGLVIFTDTIEHSIPPRKGRKHSLSLIRELLAFQPQHRRTDITHVLEYLNRVIKKRSIVFLMSDFRCHGYEFALRIAGKRHDLIAITIIDEWECIKKGDIPDVGLMELEDLETGERIIVDTHHPGIRKQFKELVLQQHIQRRAMLADINSIDIILRRDAGMGTKTDMKSYSEPLADFFRARARNQTGHVLHISH